VKPLAAQGFLLGIMPGEQYREKSIELEPGDRLCIYTDGVVESRNEIGEVFGTERLTECLLARGRDPAEQIARGAIEDLNAFRGPQHFSDDVSLLIAELANADHLLPVSSTL
jgi:sigma-B regulation protein RsbU (phosphoserine phosphatase)